jgi:type VI protein secretion system component VasF
MDHHEQHHQHHQKEREEKKKEQKQHEQALEKSAWPFHPIWLVALGGVLVLAAILIYTLLLS